MQIRTRTTRAKRSRRGLAAALGLALGAMTALGAAATAPIAAAAAELDTVTSITINTESSSDPLYVGERFEVQLEWSAPERAVAGDTFRVDFASPVRAYDASFELRAADGTVIGDCVVSANSFLCTFNDYVDTHNSVSGSLYFYAQSTEATDEDDFIFETGNGITIAVPVPGGGVIIGEPGEAPTSPQKWGWQSEDGSSITWQIVIPSENLAPIGGAAVVLTDVYDERLGFEPRSISASWVEKTNWNTGPRQPVEEGTTPDTYSVVDSPATHSFELTINEPNTDGTRVYSIMYTTPLPADAKNGDFFSNTVTANGEQYTSWPVEYVTAGGEGGGIADEGAFTVTKSVTGEGASLIPSDAQFTVDYSYVLNGETLTGTLTVSAGETAGLTALPTDTVVTLSEATPTSVDGVAYGTPVFSGTGVAQEGSSATLTIGDRTVVAVSLENPVTVVPPVVPPVEPPVTVEEPPVPSTPAKPHEPALASTGVDLLAGGVAVAFLLLTGVALMRGSRKRVRG